MTSGVTTGSILRKLLLANPEGMTVREMSKSYGIPQDVVSAALGRNYGFYVADWVLRDDHTDYVSLWRCVPVPESPPRKRLPNPDRQFSYRAKYRNAQLDRELEASRLKYEAERKRIREEKAAQKEAKRMEREAAKAQRAAERAAAKKPKLEAAAPAGYVPQKTKWAFPPPWAN